MVFTTQMRKIKIIRILCKDQYYLHPNLTIKATIERIINA
jgi:hypothetical protein